MIQHFLSVVSNKFLHEGKFKEFKFHPKREFHGNKKMYISMSKCFVLVNKIYVH
jgi:hypothetical protein